MWFEFDLDKDVANRRKHGLSLAFGQHVLTDPDILETLDDTMDSGEERFLALGKVGDTIYAVIYTERAIRRPDNIRSSCGQTGTRTLLRTTMGVIR